MSELGRKYLNADNRFGAALPRPQEVSATTRQFFEKRLSHFLSL
jgi:hypothetical protein